MASIPREIGWAVQPNRDDGHEFQDIYLYDNAAGGAGYVAATGMFIEELLEATKQQLKCTCNDACHHCLLSFDTQHHVSNLNRIPALDFLSNAFFEALKVPEHYQCFGADTQWESGTITEGVLRRLIKPGVKALEIVAAGDPNHWDIEAWRMWRHLTKLSTSDVGVQVRILIPESVIGSLDWPVLNSAVTKAVGRSMECAQIADDQISCGSGRLIARMLTAEETVQWAVFENDLLTPGMTWGAPTTEQPTVRCKSDKEPLISGRSVTLDQVNDLQPNNCKVLFVDGDFDGQITSFGEKFWNATASVSPLLKDLLADGAPSKIVYTDRYLRSPLTARLLHEIISYAVPKPSDMVLDIATTWKRPDRTSNSIRGDWDESSAQKKCLETLFGDYQVSIRIPSDFRVLDHARKLSLYWPDGSGIMLVLDQGVGFLNEKGRVPFDFNLSPSKQAKDLKGKKFEVSQSGRGVPIYIMNVK